MNKEQEILTNLEAHFLEFIKKNPQVNIYQLSKESGQCKDSLRHFITGRNKKLNRFTKPAILEVMRRHGFDK
jgi:hypothetical protein